MPRGNEKENTVTQKNSNILLSIIAPQDILAYKRYPIWAFSFCSRFCNLGDKHDPSPPSILKPARITVET